MTLRYDPRVRKGSRLAKATLSPAGLLTGAALAGLGAISGIGLPWVIGAGLTAWLTSVVLHLRDPELVSSMLAPDFDRDLRALDSDHRPMMVAGLEARDRFDEAVASLADTTGYGGMSARINGALERLYDSLLWAQRAAGFLVNHPPEVLKRRIAAAGPGTRLAEELAAQMEEVAEIERRRAETLQRSAATVTGIETLAVKVGTVALEASAPGPAGQHDEISQLRSELDGYLEGLEEIQDALKTLPPQIG